MEEKDIKSTGLVEIKEDVKTTIDLSELPPKQAAFALLKEQGIATKDAAQMLGYNHSYARQIAPKIAKYSLTTSKMVKSANKAVKNIIEGKPWGTIDKIKDSTALMASQMVYDRIDPVVRQNLNVNANIDISPIDLDRYRTKE